MKNTILQICSAILALFVLVSTLSWTVDKHLCMGRVVAISFFSKAHGCGMEMLNGDSKGFEKSWSSCSNETVVVQGQDELKVSSIDFEISHKIQIWSDPFFFPFTSIFAPNHVTFLGGKDPPLLRKVPIYRYNEQYLI